MKAYKIISTITKKIGDDVRIPNGQWKDETKEFYHLTEDGAHGHVAQYIFNCSLHNIVLEQKSSVFGECSDEWIGINKNTGSTYYVCILEIDIKD